MARADAPLDIADELVLRSTAGAVAIITLNRPAQLNAWTAELGEQYFALLDRAVEDPAVRAIVVTGAGRGFCAGADMGVLEGIGPDAPPPPQQPRPYSSLLSIPKPVIAAINGPCAGVGLALAMTCDLRFAAEDAKFTTAFARRGLIAEYGLAWLLVRSLGPSRALDLLLSARTLLAPEAHELGLVDRVHSPDDVLAAAIEYAGELAERSSPHSMAVIKGQVVEALGSDLLTAEQRADDLMHASFAHPDLAEGVASFVERRLPEFRPLDA